MIYFKTRVLKYITFTFVPATFELYQLGVPIRVKKRYILVLHGEVYRFRGPYKDDLRCGHFWDRPLALRIKRDTLQATEETQ